MSVETLTRFRADPSRVRVSIRRIHVGWLATVRNRAVRLRTLQWHSDPTRAVMKALARAARAGVGGIDLEFQWAYPHPHGKKND